MKDVWLRSALASIVCVAAVVCIVIISVVNNNKMYEPVYSEYITKKQDVIKKDEKNEQDEELKSNADAPVSDIVYFTPNGKKYHKSQNCSTLSRSKTVDSSTVREAESKGLTPCSVCAG